MGQLYTQTVKLDANNDGSGKTYIVKSFLLYDDNGTPGDTSDDVLIMATPMTGSEYANYVSKPVEFEFVVNAFEKIQIDIEVLCFLPAKYNFFGFTWFAVNQIVIRELCFFVDICLNGDPWFPESFAVPPYGPPIPGIDVPGAMRIWAFKAYNVTDPQFREVPDPAGDGTYTPVPHSPFTNWDPQEGLLSGPLCIQYPDDPFNNEDQLWFWIQFYLPDPAGNFLWQTYAIGVKNGGLVMRDRNDNIRVLTDKEDDGIYDFVVGSCGDDGVADWTFEWLLRPN
jgi:hypothetical protein